MFNEIMRETDIHGVIDELIDDGDTDDSVVTTASEPRLRLAGAQRLQVRGASLVMVDEACRTREIETLRNREGDQAVTDDDRVGCDGEREGNNREERSTWKHGGGGGLGLL